jgi:hypothetical protein
MNPIIGMRPFNLAICLFQHQNYVIYFDEVGESTSVLNLCSKQGKKKESQLNILQIILIMIYILSVLFRCPWNVTGAVICIVFVCVYPPAWSLARNCVRQWFIRNTGSERCCEAADTPLRIGWTWLLQLTPFASFHNRQLMIYTFLNFFFDVR